ncbi:hypothetical protein ZWY2020_019434 [Hordeum vulgare]|nr:hypothetical protein ZWY2020_019434 [Hordeum vulgare]
MPCPAGTTTSRGQPRSGRPSSATPPGPPPPTTNVVDAVTLLALIVEPLAVSALAICLRSEQYVFDAFKNQPVANVVAADDRIVVLDAKFRCRHSNDDPHRFLVYDAFDASLAMVPPVCENGSARPSSRPILFPCAAATTLAVTRWPSWRCTTCTSRRHGPLFPPEKPKNLSAHTAFTFQGRAYWADLGQGLLSCDSDDLLYGRHEVPFSFVPLPPECRVCQLCSNIDHKGSRAMTVHGGSDSIKLVCIGKGRGFEACDMCGEFESTLDMALASWALDIATGQWRRDDGGEDLRVASLWQMESFKTAGLPRVRPILPILIPQKDDGGDVLCFTLQAGDAGPVHLCRLNMRTKTLLPPHGLLDEWTPSLLGCDLFKHIEFATTPDNNEEEEMEVLAPKRRRRRRKRKRMKICP